MISTKFSSEREFARAWSKAVQHPSTRQIYRYWNELRGARYAPEQIEMDLTAVRKSLGDSLLLSADRNGEVSIRLAGTRVCALFGRELKAHPFFGLWDQSSRPLLRGLVAAVGDELTAIEARAVGRTKCAEAELEILLLPLMPCEQLNCLIVGVLAPIAIPAWIGADPIQALALRHFRPVAGRSLPYFHPPSQRRAFDDPLRLTVYEGGRSLCASDARGACLPDRPPGRARHRKCGS